MVMGKNKKHSIYIEKLAFIAVYASVFLFVYFVFENVYSDYPSTKRLDLLLISVAVAVLGVILLLLLGVRIFVSNLLILCFVTMWWIVVRQAIDIDIHELVSINFSVFGVVHSLFSGVLLGLIIYGVFVSASLHAKHGHLFLIASFALVAYVAYQGSLDLLLTLRNDIFVMENTEGYQRRGDLIIIASMVLSSIVVNYIDRTSFDSRNSAVYKKNRILGVVHFAIVLLYVVVLGVLLWSLLMIGSKKGMLGTLMVMLSTTICLFSLWMANFRWKRQLLTNKKNKVVISGFVFKSVALHLCVILMVVGVYWDLFTYTAIGGYGNEGVNSSVVNRLKMFEYLLEYLDVSFPAGNVAHSELAGRDGSYIHSLFFSFLISFGMPGLILFVALNIVGVKVMSSRYIRINQCGYLDYNILAVHNIMMYLSILFVGVISANYVWSPFWFAFGMLVLPAAIVRKKNIGIVKVGAKVIKKESLYA